MIIESFEWLSLEAEEAEVIVSDGTYKIVCFSQPFRYEVGEMLEEPLEVLDIENLHLSSNVFVGAERINESFEYHISAKVIDKAEGIVQIGKIFISIDNFLLKYIDNNEIVDFSTSRIDIY
ncbi:MAG: hypothetical protein WCR42_07815 [bacterium]